METTKLEFTEKQLAAWRKEYASQATDEQFNLWIEDCKMRGLVPVRDVVLQIRGVKEYDAEAGAKVFKKKAIYITTIAALRKLAQRSKLYAGQLPTRWIYLDTDGSPSIESEVPLPVAGSTEAPREPWAVRVRVLRKDFSEPLQHVARFNAYAQTYTKDNKSYLNQTWETRGPEQLEKCAIAGAIRAAFPEETDSLYVSEEWEKQFREEAEDNKVAQPQTVVAAPAPTVAPAVDHTPAEGKDVPRPGEEKPKTSRKKKDEPKQSEPAPAAPAPAEEKAPAGEPDKAPEAPATSEERQAAAVTLRKYIEGGVDKEQLKSLCLRVSGAKTTADISKAQWDDILARLSAAKETGKLKDILEG